MVFVDYTFTSRPNQIPSTPTHSDNPSLKPTAAVTISQGDSYKNSAGRAHLPESRSCSLSCSSGECLRERVTTSRLLPVLIDISGARRYIVSYRREDRLGEAPTALFPSAPFPESIYSFAHLTDTDRAVSFIADNWQLIGFPMAAQFFSTGLIH
uniref:CheW-like domain-containing protein n=1 Tax=Steinernema glaseri TaxID=37863 RepID=A0A1I7Y864_9BILA